MVSLKLGSGNEMTITGQYYNEIRIAECNEWESDAYHVQVTRYK